MTLELQFYILAPLALSPTVVTPSAPAPLPFETNEWDNRTGVSSVLVITVARGVLRRMIDVLKRRSPQETTTVPSRTRDPIMLDLRCHGHLRQGDEWLETHFDLSVQLIDGRYSWFLDGQPIEWVEKNDEPESVERTYRFVQAVRRIALGRIGGSAIVGLSGELDDGPERPQPHGRGTDTLDRGHDGG